MGKIYISSISLKNASHCGNQIDCEWIPWWLLIYIHTYIHIYNLLGSMWVVSVSCGRIINLLTAANNIINQLKLTRTLKCLLQLWKGFFERNTRSRSQTAIKGCAHLSNPCLWCFLQSLAFNSTWVSFCLTEDNLFHPAWNSVYVFLSLNLNFLACWEKS